jgi:hypothetical protein
MYNPSAIPVDFPEPARLWMADELARIAAAFERAERVTLDIHHAEPEKYEDGVQVYADGTNWDPGSGEGVYVRYNSLWNKL